MVGKGLAYRSMQESGIVYGAGEFAETFISSLTSSYIRTLTTRAAWVVKEFGSMTDAELKARIGEYFEHWIEQFQVPYKSVAGDQ